MHVGFRIVRNVVVHHQRDAVHVDTAGGNIGRDDDIELAHLEAVNRAFAHRLCKVAVQRRHVEPAAFQLLGNFSGVLLGAHKNQHTVKIFAFEHTGERLDLVLVLYQQKTLADVFDRSRLALDAGLFVFTEMFLDNLLHIIRHRGAEKGALAIRRDFFQDGIHVFHESHVEHLVGFVEHDGLHAGEHDGSALDMVDKAPRSRNDNVRGTLECAHLDGDVLPAVNRNHVHLRELDGVLLDSFCHLDGKFARRREHEH